MALLIAFAFFDGTTYYVKQRLFLNRAKLCFENIIEIPVEMKKELSIISLQ